MQLPTLPPTWVPDDAVNRCESCQVPFSTFLRRHHCRACGHIYCHACSAYTVQCPPSWGFASPQRACFACYEKTKVTAGAPQDEEEILMQFYLRDAPWTFNRALPGIGRRARDDKQYFMLCEKDGREVMACLVSSKRAASSFKEESTRRAFMRVLELCKHPCLTPLLKADCIVERDRVFLLRNVNDKGSLRDVVKGVSWKNAYGRKYAKPGEKQSPNQIAKWGRQILEGLAHLKALGLPYPHLSLTNTLVNADGTVTLCDYENTLLGLPYPRLPMGALRSSEFLEVDLFGQMIYELATGSEAALLPPQPDGSATIPPGVVEPIGTILRQVFSTQPPSVEDLLRNAFFSSAPPPPGMPDKPRPSSSVASFIAAAAATVPAMLEERTKVERVEAEKAAAPSTSPPLSPRLANINEANGPSAAGLTRRGTKKSSQIKAGRSSSDLPNRAVSPPLTSSGSNRALSPPAVPPRATSPPAVPPRATSPPVPPVRRETQANTPTSVSTASKPPSAPPPPSKPPAAAAPKTALLSSIEGFNAKKLKKTTTNDRSAPKFNK